MGRALETVKAFYAAADAGKGDDMVALFSPDIAWTEMATSPYGGTYHGAEEILGGVFGKLDAEWEDFKFTPDRFHDAGDSVVASGHYTAVYRKTDKPMRCRTLHVWDVKDGKITGFEQFCDTLLMSQALG